MNKNSKPLLILCLMLSTLSCYSAENVFYILRNSSVDRISSAQSAFKSLKQHYQFIHILIPQAYQIDENGLVWGNVDAEVRQFTQTHHIKLMPLVTNTKFDKAKAHLFLSNKKAQQTAIESLLKICEQNHYYGLQIDFEMIALSDSDALTEFYQATASALHAKGFSISYAVAPIVESNPQPSDYLKRLYENWQGAYDLKALAQSADFITIMSYNQHAGRTTPGSTAGYPWVERTVEYALQYIPAEKISLGIPSYSNYWYIGKDSETGKWSTQMAGISYAKADYLVHKYKANLMWDPENKINFAIYNNNWLNEYLFIENQQSFVTKCSLVKKYGLRGISVFDLGSEDPAIWNKLQDGDI